MNDLIDTVGLRSIINGLGEKFNKLENFEDVYSALKEEKVYEEEVAQLESAVEEYFKSLELPDQATLYDRLLLSLRGTDAIFTFNWDPFLFDAHERNRSVVHLPKIFFLHGNVRIGQCPEHPGPWERIDQVCQQCSGPLKKVPLLYPVKQKDYSAHPYIKDSWKAARCRFKKASVITIFGYGAPESDRDAVDLLNTSWLEGGDRKLEHIEILDTSDGSRLYERWIQFSPTHHLHIHKDFNKSWIAKYPRRSREAVKKPSLFGEPCKAFPLTWSLLGLQQEAREIAKYEVQS